MKKKCLLFVVAALMLGTLTGCFRSVDELFTLPKLPEEYQNLQEKIEEVTTGTGAEYAAPIMGANNQPVQLQDLDGDGVMEALAFFRVSASGDDKPQKIYIFRLTEEGYELGAVIEGEGSAINSISYEDLSGGPGKELVVSWLVSGNAYVLSVYSIEQYQAAEVLRTGYTSFELQDLDMDNRKEIAVVRLDTIEGKSRVEFYDAEENDLVLRSSPMLSQGVTGIVTDGVQTGYLRGDAEGNTTVPGLFITSYQGEGVVTDIFAWRDGALENITLESSEAGSGVGVSNSTRRSKDDAMPTDINDDNFLEIPMPMPLISSGGTTTAETLYTWIQYDLTGTGTPVFTTYHNFDDGWYFILPDWWENKITVSQYSTIGEKATAFSLWTGEDQEPQTFLTIYKLTGPNRYTRSRMGDRFTLTADENTIYSAELKTNAWDCGLDAAGVQELFKQSTTDW